MSLDDALAKPTPDPILFSVPEPRLSAEVSIEDDIAEVTLPRVRPDTEGHEALRAAGLNPDEWVAKAYRTSEWTMANGELGTAVRWSFERKPDERPHIAPRLDELFAAIGHRPAPAAEVSDGPWGFIVALGDMQFGKIDGDGADGTLRRALDCLEQARAKFDEYGDRYPVGHVLLSFLGDHVEGFQSQGGANVWRTPLTLNEQIRLVRRTMLHALQLFADCSAPKLTMVAIPGNHGETTRFAGKGVTRYDDSHDTEALVAVAEAAGMDPERFRHCRFVVPDTDELTVVVEVAGTIVGHAHGHQWRPGQHMKWWQGQAFGTSPLRSAHLLLAGHLHHFHAQSEGGRTFVQVPALEHSSAWWRHQTGTGGDPGIVVALTHDGVTPVLEVVRPAA